MGGEKTRGKKKILLQVKVVWYCKWKLRKRKKINYAIIILPIISIFFKDFFNNT